VENSKGQLAECYAQKRDDEEGAGIVRQFNVESGMKVVDMM
jgi:hypothetical protein